MSAENPQPIEGLIDPLLAEIKKALTILDKFQQEGKVNSPKFKTLQENMNGRIKNVISYALNGDERNQYSAFPDWFQENKALVADWLKHSAILPEVKVLLTEARDPNAKQQLALEEAFKTAVSQAEDEAALISAINDYAGTILNSEGFPIDKKQLVKNINDIMKDKFSVEKLATDPQFSQYLAHLNITSNFGIRDRLLAISKNKYQKQLDQRFIEKIKKCKNETEFANLIRNYKGDITVRGMAINKQALADSIIKKLGQPDQVLLILHNPKQSLPEVPTLFGIRDKVVEFAKAKQQWNKAIPAEPAARPPKPQNPPPPVPPKTKAEGMPNPPRRSPPEFPGTHPATGFTPGHSATNAKPSSSAVPKRPPPMDLLEEAMNATRERALQDSLPKTLDELKYLYQSVQGSSDASVKSWMYGEAKKLGQKISDKGVLRAGQLEEMQKVFSFLRSNTTKTAEEKGALAYIYLERVQLDIAQEKNPLGVSKNYLPSSALEKVCEDLKNKITKIYDANFMHQTHSPQMLSELVKLEKALGIFGEKQKPSVPRKGV